jgi:hypothetical protein
MWESGNVNDEPESFWKYAVPVVCRAKNELFKKIP